MKITRSSDWRDAIPFDSPVAAADVLPGESARCVLCGVDAPPYGRDELWVVKQRHPHNPAGTVRLYCGVHVPRPAPPVVEPVAAGRAGSRTARAPRAPRATPERRTAPVVERPAVLCPDCFVEVPPTGICGMCGQRVA
jgi:hypothetical protein